MPDPIRVIHLDTQFFGDINREAAVFREAFGTIESETYEYGVNHLEVGKADIVITMGTSVTANLLAATECTVVAVYATGYDMVDIDAATSRGVVVTRVPEYCNDEVGQHVIALALALQRGLPKYDAAVKSNDYDWKLANPLFSWDRLTFGFIAFGRKARAAAGYAGSLGFDLVAFDPYVDDEDIRMHGASPASFDEVIETSDVVSIHAPLTSETENLIDAETFNKMKEGAVLLNTSRGEIVDEKALVDALDDGPLFGAGLDVTREEPPSHDNPLLDRDDVILTPHVAWNSEGAIERLRKRGSEIAVAAYEGRSVAGIVNPEARESARHDTMENNGK